nr:hypothetical protein [Actinokineospora alba]
MPLSTALSELADRMRTTPARRWSAVHDCFGSWVDGPTLRSVLRQHLLSLGPDKAAALIGRSRETTTHFAWCLRDREAEPFTFWLHEYKPQSDWRPGYADSVHNHRYHFCTVILRGGYLHERYATTIDPDTGLISAATLLRRTECGVGESGFLLADEFHRIPSAADQTMTFLVKSRPVSAASLSFDPATKIGHRHVPVESRLEELTSRI